MKASLNSPQREGQDKEPQFDNEMDDLLCYADQASFVGLRALGHQPVMHFTWIYPNLLDEERVNQFNENLAKGILGRVLQRSPWPWGRHRWVARRAPAEVTWFRRPIAVESLMERRIQLVDLTIDPEQGPAWRLVVQWLHGGGCALSLLVSHTIADVKAATQAIADALAGKHLQRSFPSPSSRFTPRRMARDIWESVKELPVLWTALAALYRHSRSTANVLGSASPKRIEQVRSQPIMLVPLVEVVMDANLCKERANELAINSNMLLAVLTVRLALRAGRVDTEGRVKLVLPVSERQPTDRRGNALRSISVMVDPIACLANPRMLQDQIRASLAQLRQKEDDMSLMLPLVPYVPLGLVRRLEHQALGGEWPVGCSLVGQLPLELQHPLSEASSFRLSAIESFTKSQLEQLGGILLLLCTRLGGKEIISVFGYLPNVIHTRDELAPFVQQALSDLGLNACIH